MSSRRERGGKIVVFLGPDGAGKSTVLELVAAGLAERGVPCVTRYFAPGFLRRYRPRGQAKPTIAPHAGRQYGALRSFLKVTLLMFEFCVGIARARRSGQVQLFDRFLHDVLVDPVRYRLGRVRWWMRGLLRFAPEPDLAVVLVAPCDVIRARKQEVPVEETSRQIDAYSRVADRFRAALLLDNSRAPEDIAQQVLAEVTGT